MLRVTHSKDSSETLVIRIEGALLRDEATVTHKALLSALKTARGPRVALELELERVDATGAALIERFRRDCIAKNRVLSLRSASEPAKAALSRVRINDEGQDPEKPKREPLVTIGDNALKRWASMKNLLQLTADTFVWSFGGAKRTRRVRKGALWVEANRIGVDSLGIVGLIAFLVGTVVALQSAYQLRQFGADIFVANLIGVSMTREMGPLMTAIIMAGRSGASIAAEIATMSVNEEVDSLKVMGLEPGRYIVVPKFQAITITMPALTIFASLLGIMGGFLVALFYMQLSASTFFGQLFSSLVVKDILSGLVKSVAFAWIIVLVAAHQGFQAYGGAEAVGKVTTTSVVLSIFWVIVADAAFNMIFYF